jgi:hypothetical protein
MALPRPVGVYSARSAGDVLRAKAQILEGLRVTVVASVAAKTIGLNPHGGTL